MSGRAKELAVCGTGGILNYYATQSIRLKLHAHSGEVIVLVGYKKRFWAAMELNFENKYAVRLTQEELKREGLKYFLAIIGIEKDSPDRAHSIRRG